jgi:hypothetical protein
MTWEYWTIYKPDTKQRLNLRCDERWGWEIDIHYDNIHESWEKIPENFLPQVEPHIKKWGFKTPRNIYDEDTYKKALDRLDKLMDAKPDSTDAYELEMLIAVIEPYEDEHYPISEPSEEDIREFREDQERLL